MANYREVFADPQFWNSFKITLLFMLLVAPARVILSFPVGWVGRVGGRIHLLLPE